MKTQEFRDLGKLARGRCRESAGSVLQLLESDQERAALLVSIALDFINGATVMLTDDETDEHESLGHVIRMTLGSLGHENVLKALEAAEKGKRRKQ